MGFSDWLGTFQGIFFLCNNKLPICRQRPIPAEGERGFWGAEFPPGSINWVNEQRLMLIGCYQEKNQVFFQESWGVVVRPSLSHKWAKEGLHNSVWYLPWRFNWWRIHLQLKRMLQCRRPAFDTWVGKIPWRRKWKFTPVFLPGKPQGQRSLVGCSPWGPNNQTWLSN